MQTGMDDVVDRAGVLTDAGFGPTAQGSDRRPGAPLDPSVAKRFIEAADVVGLL